MTLMDNECVTEIVLVKACLNFTLINCTLTIFLPPAAIFYLLKHDKAQQERCFSYMFVDFACYAWCIKVSSFSMC